MRHSFVDRYSDIASPIHRLDPRTKFVCLVLFVILVVTTPSDRFLSFGAYAGVMLLLIGMSKVPFSYVIKRACLVLPFAFMTALFLPFWATTADSPTVMSFSGIHITRYGLMLVWNVTVKAVLSVFAMILLSSSTPFNSLLKGLESLKFPRIMLMILSFMYRYIFVVVDQALRMECARESRSCGHKRNGRPRVLVNMIGLLFIRAYERAERVYQSMISRGFDGEIKSTSELKFFRGDYVFASAFLAGVVAIRLASGI